MFLVSKQQLKPVINVLATKKKKKKKNSCQWIIDQTAHPTKY